MCVCVCVCVFGGEGRGEMGKAGMLIIINSPILFNMCELLYGKGNAGIKTTSEMLGQFWGRLVLTSGDQ